VVEKGGVGPVDCIVLRTQKTGERDQLKRTAQTKKKEKRLEKRPHYGSVWSNSGKRIRGLPSAGLLFFQKRYGRRVLTIEEEGRKHRGQNGSLIRGGGDVQVDQQKQWREKNGSVGILPHHLRKTCYMDEEP